MYLHRCWSAALLAAAVVLGTAQSHAADRASTEQEIRTITQALLDAVATGDKSVWDTHLDENLVHVDENGTVRTKAELLTELRPLPAGLVGRLKIDKFKLTLDGDVAVAAHEDQEYLNYHGQELHSRFRSLDVWHKKATGWKLIGQHVAAVLADPPAITMSKDQLCAYAGTYDLTAEIKVDIACEAGKLVARRSGRPEVTLLPEAPDVFFSPGKPRSRRIFQRDAKGSITGFADRREGQDLVWRRK